MSKPKELRKVWVVLIDDDFGPVFHSVHFAQIDAELARDLAKEFYKKGRNYGIYAGPHVRIAEFEEGQ